VLWRLRCRSKDVESSGPKIIWGMLLYTLEEIQLIRNFYVHQFALSKYSDFVNFIKACLNYNALPDILKPE
jgi:hypothetical protein